MLNGRLKLISSQCYRYKSYQKIIILVKHPITSDFVDKNSPKNIVTTTLNCWRNESSYLHKTLKIYISDFYIPYLLTHQSIPQNSQ